MPSFRFGLCALAASALVSTAGLVGPAGAETGSGPPPACAPGNVPTVEQPCVLPPCPVGVQPTRDAPCAKPLGPGPKPSQQPGQSGSPGPRAPGGPGSDGSGKPGPGGDKSGDKAGDKAGDKGAPPLKAGFMSRVWRLSADADSYDGTSNTLNVTVSKIFNLPKRFNSQDNDIVDQDADVIFTKKTKVYDAEGKRLRIEGKYDVALDEARSVSVTGKILPQSKWNKDEDGSPVTTLRAKRVTITG
jgi:hypothetical protein